MVGYQDPEMDATEDWSFSLAFAQDQAKYAFPAQDLQPCKNVDCANKSYAIFCSEDCRVTCEGDDTEDYYRDDQSNVTLGHRATADAQYQADLAAGGFAAMVCGVQPQEAAVAVPAPVPAFPEAPVSCTVKGLRHGQDVMLTIRGTSFADVQAQLDAATAWFDAPAAPAQSPPMETGEGYCDRHSTQMRWNPAKGGESGWWSHKGPDGWCKGGSKGKVRHG